MNTSIIPLIEKWEMFNRLNNKGDIIEFAKWVLENDNPTKTELQQASNFKIDNVNLKGEYPKIPSASGITGYIIVRLFKALKFYFKPVLLQNNLSSIDDLFFLSTLAWKPGISKKAICQTNMTDIPTGMDILKRLLKNQLIIEKENSEDKREKLLSLTDKGWEKISTVFSNTQYVQDVLADLKEEDRTILLTFLDHLNHFHTKVFLSTVNQ